MLLNKLMLDAATFCSTDEGRYAINHLRVSSDTVEATDGHRLIRVTRRQTSHPESDFPEIIKDADQPTEPFFILRSLALSLAKQVKAINGAAKRIPVLANVQVLIRTLADKTKQLVFGTTDLENPTISTAKVDELTFPNIDAVLPKKQSADFAISLNAHYVAEICKYAASFDLGRQPMITMEFHEAGEPMTFRWSDGDHEAMAVLMPMRNERINMKMDRKAMRSALEGFLTRFSEAPVTMQDFFSDISVRVVAMGIKPTKE